MSRCISPALKYLDGNPEGGRGARSGQGFEEGERRTGQNISNTIITQALHAMAPRAKEKMLATVNNQGTLQHLQEVFHLEQKQLKHFDRGMNHARKARGLIVPRKDWTIV
jgi:hypothetical protein